MEPQSAPGASDASIRRPEPSSPALRVFIACTAHDLAEHAAVVREQVARLQWVHVHHPLWGATGRPPVSECRERVRSCDLLVVLVAHRYGWQPTHDELGDGRRSITWLETAEARACNIPVLPFIVQSQSLWRADWIEDRSSTHGRLLEEFKAELRRGTCGEFSERPDSLAQPVYQSLSEAGLRLAAERRNLRVPSDARTHAKVEHELQAPSLLRDCFDRAWPWLHAQLTKAQLLQKPRELDELRSYLTQQKANLEAEIHHKLYIPNVAKPVPRSPFAMHDGAHDFERPIQQVIRQVLGRSHGGDSASAQIAAVNRRSRVVRNLVRTLQHTREPVVLLGDPGTGKTLTLQQTALSLIERELGRVYPKLTIYLRVSEFHVEELVTPEHVWAFLRDAVPAELAALLPALDRAARLILVFDGMDEMSRRAYTQHTEALSQFAGARLAGNSTLVSCRVTDFSPAFVHQRLVLLPFDQGRVREYLVRHFPRGVVIDHELWSAARLARHLTNEDLTFDGTNPFVLWLLCFHLSEKHSFPKSRVDLIGFYIDQAYERKRKELARDEPPFPPKAEVLFMWSRLAYAITLRNRGSDVELAALDESLHAEAERLESAIRAGKRCGLLVESKDGRARKIRFENHRYQEFFTALLIRNAHGGESAKLSDDAWGLAIPDAVRPVVHVDWLAHLDSPRWQETMFSLALMGGALDGVEVLVRVIEEGVLQLEAARRKAALQAPTPSTSVMREAHQIGRMLVRVLDEGVAHMRSELRAPRARAHEGALVDGTKESAAEPEASAAAATPALPPSAATDSGATLVADSAQEIELADRVELAARMFRHARDVPRLEAELKPCVLRAVGLLTEHGNPVTQVKMIRACMQIPDVDLLEAVGAPLRSNVAWVREQALVLLAAPQRGLGANLPVEMGHDLANGSFLQRRSAYLRAISRSRQPGSMFALCVATFCSLGMLLSAYAQTLALYAGMLLAARNLQLAEWQRQSELLCWAESPLGIYCFAGVAGIATLLSFRFVPSDRWYSTVSSALYTVGGGVSLWVLWTNPSDVLQVSLAVFLSLFLAVMFGSLISAMLHLTWLAVYHAATAPLQVDPHARASYLPNAVRWLSLDSSRWQPWLFGGAFACGAALCGLPVPVAAIAGTIIAAVTRPAVRHHGWRWLERVAHHEWQWLQYSSAWHLERILRFWRDGQYRREVLSFGATAFIGGVYFISVLTGSVLLGISLLGLALSLVAGGLERYFARTLLFVVRLSSVGAGLWIIWSLLRWAASHYSALRLPFPPRYFTPAAWTERVRNSGQRPHEQENLLVRTHYQSVGVEPEEFLSLLREVQAHVTKEPALSTYWARRHELEEVLRQEHRD